MTQGTPTWAVWVPIVTASMSGVFAFVGVVVGQWMTMSRERKSRARRFQVETIVELQDALVSVRDSFLSWVHGKIDPDEMRSYYPALERARTLITRLDDEGDRSAVMAYLDKVRCEIYRVADEISGQLTKDARKPSQTKLDPRISIELHERFMFAQDALGKSLRKLHQ